MSGVGVVGNLIGTFEIDGARQPGSRNRHEALIGSAAAGPEGETTQLERSSRILRNGVRAQPIQEMELRGPSLAVGELLPSPHASPQQ